MFGIIVGFIFLIGLIFISFIIFELVVPSIESFFQDRKKKDFAAKRAAMVAELEKALDKLDKK